MSPMDLRHLRAFVALLEQRHFGRAAAELDVSQPALSQTIRQLEEELGTKLFLRDRAGVHVTDAGRALQARAGRIIKECDRAKQSIIALAESPPAGSSSDDPRSRNLLRIGFSPPYRDIVTICAASVSFDWRVRVMLQETSLGRIHGGLLEGSLDVGVARSWRQAHSLFPDRTHDYRGTCLTVVFHPNHPLARTDDEAELSLDELSKERFVLLRTGLRDRRSVDKFLHSRHFVPDIAAEATTRDAVLEFVRTRSSVVTILPAHHSADIVWQVAGLPARRLSSATWERVCIAYRTQALARALDASFHLAFEDARQLMERPRVGQPAAPDRAPIPVGESGVTEISSRPPGAAEQSKRR